MKIKKPENLNNMDVYQNKAANASDNSNVKFCKTVLSDKALFFDEYVEQAMNVLVSPSSLLITGDKGVGKTQLVQYLQYKINNYDCPKTFYGCRIYELNLLAVSHGVRFPAEFEDNLLTVFTDILDKEQQNNKMPILFIDNLSELIFNNINVLAHWYIEQAIDAGIKIIACVNSSDMKMFDTKHDLIRRFTEVKIKEPTIQETKEILKSKIPQLFFESKLEISNDICDKLVTLSDKYIKNNYRMPLKAFKVMQISIGKRLNNIAKPAGPVQDKIKKIPELQDDIVSMIRESRVKPSGAKLKNILNKNREIENIKNYINDYPIIVESPDTYKLSEEDIYSVISDLAGVPVTKLSESDTSKLKDMVPVITSKIIGQDEAVIKVTKTVKRNRLGLRKKNHTIGNFLFIGSTGVGKTFFAKKLAEYIFGSEDTLVRLDMSEYTDEISVNKLIGAPPGYVGYQEGGVLCNAIRKHPYSVILFDEIEKAHPTIYNTLLQLLDEGRITDSNGNVLSATNNIVIMTSNIGAKEASMTTSVGFSSNKYEYDRKNEETKKNTIVSAMKKRFAPEFLGRLDAICYFNDLNTEILSKIFDNEIAELAPSINELGYELNISKDVKKFIVEKSEKEKLGARALIKNIQQDIVDEMTDIIIDSENNKKKVNVIMDKKKENISIKLA